MDARPRKRRRKGRMLTPEQLRAMTERRRWWRWEELFNKALASLIEHHPTKPGLVKYAERLADEGIKVHDRRMPPSVRDDYA